MRFCLSICAETHRVILDQDSHGEVIAMVEGRNWKEARREALKKEAMDRYTYVKGKGWMLRLDCGIL